MAAAPGPMRTTSPPQYEQQQYQQQQQAKPGHMAKMQSGPVTGASDDGGDAGGEPVGYNAAEFKVRVSVLLVSWVDLDLDLLSFPGSTQPFSPHIVHNPLISHLTSYTCLLPQLFPLPPATISPAAPQRV